MMTVNKKSTDFDEVCLTTELKVWNNPVIKNASKESFVLSKCNENMIPVRKRCKKKN